MDIRPLLPDLKKICLDAGQAIMAVYQRPDFDVQTKGDNSPVTAADLAAHLIIKERLAVLTPDIPQLSEEDTSISDDVRLSWTRLWCIDPLDGTKEFIRRNDEFTVNIALIEKGQPIFGIIHLPATGITYWGGHQLGAWKQENDGVAQAIHSRTLGPALTVTASRRHGQDENDLLLKALSQYFNPVENITHGSSLKMCLIAEGLADFYPRLFPTSEWDTAAAQAIVEAAGGLLIDAQTRVPLSYNQRSSLLNPFFYVVGDPAFPFHTLGLPEKT
ncbi:MAG: 3'(2'),5'-bisphosphate nucleotidase CysQ [Pontibacterium sp.]